MQFTLSLPDWLTDALAGWPDPIPTLEDRMRLVIDLSRRNFSAGTGGPFAAAVFERDSGRLVAVGVNRVVPSACSSAHAEVMALSLAQQRLGTYDLGGADLPDHQLVVNWRPCAMCYGAAVWSGVRALVIAGSDDALETITGFDEGPIHPDWRGQLVARGIDVTDNVLRDEAVAVFHAFAASNALVYNGRRGSA